MSMSHFFKDCQTAEDVKATYKKLALKYHPDVNFQEDTTEIMKSINEQYMIAFKELKNTHVNMSGKQYTTNKETMETPEEFMNIINVLITLIDIKVELIGSWIWVTGDTKTHKEVLKGLGFKYAPKKQAWAWHKENDVKKTKNKYNLNDIRNMFGTQEFEQKTATAIS